MKRFSLLCLLALTLSTVAMANIIPTSTTITGTGPFTWTYDLQLSKDQNINSGMAPISNPVPHDNLTFAGFLTIYDFAGYVNGSCSAPTGWSCTAQNLGFTPNDVMPSDNPNIVNLTWSYLSGPTIMGQPQGVDLGLFSAQSIYNAPTMVSYTARGIANAGPQVGSIADNVGNTQGPTPTPEPATLGLLGVGLTFLGGLQTKVKSARG
jgi:hypothetical protein